MKEIFNGEVARDVINRGTKSEHEGIVLKTAAGQVFRLYVEGDNPFEYQSVKPLVGLDVSVEGTVDPADKRGILRVKQASDITVIGPHMPSIT